MCSRMRQHCVRWERARESRGVEHTHAATSGALTVMSAGPMVERYAPLGFQEPLAAQRVIYIAVRAPGTHVVRGLPASIT